MVVPKNLKFHGLSALVLVLSSTVQAMPAEFYQIELELEALHTRYQRLNWQVNFTPAHQSASPDQLTQLKNTLNPIDNKVLIKLEQQFKNIKDPWDKRAAFITLMIAQNWNEFQAQDKSERNHLLKKLHEFQYTQGNCQLNFKQLRDELVSRTPNNPIECLENASLQLIDHLLSGDHNLVRHFKQVNQTPGIENAITPIQEQADNLAIADRIQLVKEQINRQEPAELSSHELEQYRHKFNLDRIRPIAQKFFSDMKLDVEGVSFYHHPTARTTKLGSTGFISVPHDIRVHVRESNSPESNWEVLVHELGHAAHAKNIQQKYFVWRRLPTSSWINEGIGMLLTSVALHPKSLKKYLGLSEREIAYYLRHRLSQGDQIFDHLHTVTLRAGFHQALISQQNDNIIDTAIPHAVYMRGQMDELKDRPWSDFQTAVFLIVIELEWFINNPYYIGSYVKGAKFAACLYQQFDWQDHFESSRIKLGYQLKDLVFKHGSQFSAEDLAKRLDVDMSDKENLNQCSQNYIQKITEQTQRQTPPQHRPHNL